MNLALLRVCAAVMIMSSLYNIASLFFNMFTAEMTGDVNPIGFFIASLLLCVIIFALGTVALVKQNVLVLKIYAVCVVVSILGGTVVDIMNFNRLPLGVSYSHLFNSLLERIVINQERLHDLACFNFARHSFWSMGQMTSLNLL